MAPLNKSTRQRPCLGRCGRLVPHGQPRCAACARVSEQRRGSAAQRGYDRTWERFREFFIQLLVQAGIVPVCGAALPEGPNTKQYSRCQAEGILNGEDLHVDHDPPLTPAERRDTNTVCDPKRVGLLCRSCHSVKTAREQGLGLGLQAAL